MDMRDLYQEVILDHYRKPRNYTALGEANHEAEGHNPLCGDKIHVYAKIEDGVVKDVSFEGAGCAISTASASLMTEAIKGKTVQEAEALFRRFRQLVAGKEEADPDAAAGGDEIDLGKLEALAGVREIPIRVKCATLAWHTLHAALAEKDETVTTESA